MHKSRRRGYIITPQLADIGELLVSRRRGPRLDEEGSTQQMADTMVAPNLVTVTMTVNGKEYTQAVEPRTLLVHFIRENLGLTGTHIGCDTSSCGACIVHMNGRASSRAPCWLCRPTAPRSLTIEGLGSADNLHPVQEGFWEMHGLQCGYCTPGMIMTACLAPEAQPEPNRGRDPARPRRQHLPVHRIPEHRQGHPVGGRQDAAERLASDRLRTASRWCGAGRSSEG